LKPPQYGASSAIVLTNGAKASNVFWQVLGAANTGAGSSFAGTIMASGAITLGPARPSMAAPCH